MGIAFPIIAMVCSCSFKTLDFYEVPKQAIDFTQRTTKATEDVISSTLAAQIVTNGEDQSEANSFKLSRLKVVFILKRLAQSEPISRSASRLSCY